MFFKKVNKTSLLLLLITFIFPISTLAYSDKIMAGGENIGIEIKANGVLVVGFYEVEGIKKEEQTLQKGDILIKVNGQEITSIDEMVKIIQEADQTSLPVSYKRNGKIKSTTMKVVKDEKNIYKTGLYVKDSILGIGTLTYIDPETKLYGALGHEVADSTTGTILEVKEGSIFSSSVTSIDRSTTGEPGSKNAKLNTEDKKGDIFKNKESGIFGNYTKESDKNRLYQVAQKEDIKLGEASILTVTEEETIEKYTIQILKIDKNEDNLKNILFEIKDKRLLEKTGGIVQGMSGSPIIQGDYIIGAVTHVVVNHPDRGYGIFITTMLEEAEKKRD